MTDFVPAQDFISHFTKAEVTSMLEHGQLIMRRCHVCDEPQFSLPELARAWDKEIAIECLCHDCSWRLKED